MKHHDPRRARLHCPRATKSPARGGEPLTATRPALQESRHDPQLRSIAGSQVKAVAANEQRDHSHDAELREDTRTSGELMTPDEVLAMLSVSKSWLYGKVKDGGFPAPIKLSHKVARWRRRDIEMYIEELEAN